MAASPSPSTSHNWDAVAQCESGGNWSENTGNGYLWGLQFSASTWDANRGALPTTAYYLARGTAPARLEQIQVAETILEHSTWQTQWPRCGAYL